MLSVIKIVIGVVVFVAIIYLLSWIFGTGANLSDYADASVQTEIPGSKLATSDSTNASNYSYSIWIYITDWGGNFGNSKYVFSRGTMSPSVTLGAEDNTLTTRIALVGNVGDAASSTISNIPIQQWTNILISISDKTLDTYMNGKLVKTTVLQGLPAIPGKDASVYLSPNGGFSGFTARFRYWPNPVSPQEAWNVYKNGPGGNIITNFFGMYKLQLNFLKGGETKASVTI